MFYRPALRILHMDAQEDWLNVPFVTTRGHAEVLQQILLREKVIYISQGTVKPGCVEAT
jgi:hypothetical protein